MTVDKKAVPTATPPLSPLAPPPPEESLLTLILNLFRTTKFGKYCAGTAVVFFLLKIFMLGTFGVRSFLLLFLVPYAAREFYREFMMPQEADHKPDVFWVGVILVPTLLITMFEVKFLWQQHAASELTIEISGKSDAWAECQRFMPALFADSLNAGYYAPSINTDRAVIQYIYCKEWGNFYFSNKEEIQDMQTLWAVGTVIHEAIHVGGEWNEASTQCLTLRAFPNVLREYGVSEAKVKEYTDRYAAGSLRMPANYRDGKCDKHPLIDRLPRLFGTRK